MGFIEDIIDKVLYEASALWVKLFSNIGETVFYIEKRIDNVISIGDIGRIYNFVSGFAIGLILLKMLKKGFWTYILWRDGDPDAPLEQTITNLALAVAAAISFPTIYQWYAEISLWFIKNLVSESYGTAQIDSVKQWAEMIAVIAAKNFVMGIVVLIYLIMLFLLYCQMLKRSAELLVLRIGFPLACLGLLDSDNGVFTSTVKVFFQTSLTTTVQLFLIHLSMTLFLSVQAGVGDIFFCIAFCSAAFGSQKLLQFIMLPQGGGGGGGMYKVTGAVQTVNILKGLLPH